MAITFKSERWKPLFITIWSGQALSIIGSGFVGFSLIWWLTVETGSVSVLATASLMVLLPPIVLGPLGGTLVDRINRRLVMITADMAVALFTALLALLFLFGVALPWHIYIILFVRALAESIHQSAMLASTTLMVPEKNLIRVGGMNRAMVAIRNIAGPPLGALLISIMPIQYILFIDIVTAAVAVLPLCFILIPQPENLGNIKKTSAIASFLEGFRFLLRFRGLTFFFLFIAMTRLFARPAWQFLPLLVTQHFEGEAIHLGIMTSVFGIFAIAGGILLGVWGGFKRRIVTSCTGLIGVGLSFVIIGLASSDAYWLAVTSCAIFGITFSLHKGPIDALIQTTVPPEIQGRIFSIFEMFTMVSVPLGLAVCGILGDMLSVRSIFILGGIVILFFSLAIVLTPSIMKMEKVESKTPNP